MVQEIRALLTARKLLVTKLRDVETSLRGILRGFGLKVGAVSKGKFEARIRALVAGQAMLERVVGPLLRARAALCVEYATLHIREWLVPSDQTTRLRLRWARPLHLIASMWRPRADHGQKHEPRDATSPARAA